MFSLKIGHKTTLTERLARYYSAWMSLNKSESIHRGTKTFIKRTQL